MAFDIKGLLPSMPQEGPPLPRAMKMHWPKLGGVASLAEPWPMKLIPMSPFKGPPLPKIMGLHWPGM